MMYGSVSPLNNRSPQIEGDDNNPLPSPSLSIDVMEGIQQTTRRLSPPSSPLNIHIDEDSLESDNQPQPEGNEIEVEHIYMFNDEYHNHPENSSINNDSFININNNPISPRIKPKKRRKNRRKKRKRKQQILPKSKRIKREQIERISLLSEDEISYSNVSNDKSNPIYISSDDDDDDVLYMGEKQPFRDFPPLPHVHDLIDIIANMNVSEKSPAPSLSLSVSQFGNMTIKIQDDAHNNGHVSRQVYMHNNISSDINENVSYNDEDNNETDSWENCNLKALTLRGLRYERDISTRIATREMVQLVRAMKHHHKHLIHSSISYRNRLLALTIGILEVIQLNENGNNNRSRKAQILLICPRRHQALQARRLLMSIARFYECSDVCVIGGMRIPNLSQGVDIITATPGKLCGAIRSHRVDFSALQAIVFNGADELSSDSMCSQMHYIIDALPDRKYRVICCDSLSIENHLQGQKTMIRRCDNGISNMNEERKEITVLNQNKRDMNGMNDIKHVYKYCEYYAYNRMDALCNVLRYYRGDSCVIYFNKRSTCHHVFDYLMKNEELVRARSMCYCLDGGASNEERFHILDNFEENGGVLFATDLVNDNCFERMLIVINYDIPRYNPIVTYVKRAHSANTKFVFNLCDQYTQMELDRIASYLKINTESYYSFSRERRHHKSYRSQSILND